MSSKRSSNKEPSFPIGSAAKRELRREFVRTTDPAATIQEFQESHSLHAMMARAFGTMPIYEARAAAAAAAATAEKKDDNDDKNDTKGPQQSQSQSQATTRNVETLDTDSVMTFLSHLGLTQFEIHKRISDTLLKQLDEEIRKLETEKPLLDLLQKCWPHVVSFPYLRPVLWSVLKQLGERTPLALLEALTERGGGGDDDDDKDGGALKHAEIFKSLTPLLKRLCWEADWENRVPISVEVSSSSGQAYLKKVQATLLWETIQPVMNEYFANPVLVNAANLPFVASKSERRVLTTQRRALTSTTAAATASAPSSSSSSSTTTASLLRTSGGATMTHSKTTATPQNPFASAGKAVAALKTLLSDTTTGSAGAVYRPKLLYALLSILIVQHGSQPSETFLGGAANLHCTLTADILLSAGGSLPKAYHHVLTLAGILDESVQNGNLTNEALIKIQGTLAVIFQPEDDNKGDQEDGKDKPKKDAAIDDISEDFVTSNAMKRQLNRLITSGLNALKDNDPQNLFMNPVTDAIAYNYSKIIKEPMCISTMERKVTENEYLSLAAWESDVKLMFKNCIDYNRGNDGKWFRGEAQRQSKVFREEIFSQAKKLYQAEIIAKKHSAAAAAAAEEENRKRKAQPLQDSDSASGIAPLPASRYKRRRKDAFDQHQQQHQQQQQLLPSMPALALMLLADPFVVRLVLARLLRDLRSDVLGKASLPFRHGVIPSLLQLLHMARWSSHECGSGGVKSNRYFVPDAGLTVPSTDTDTRRVSDNDDDGDNVFWRVVPYVSLRECLPLLMGLLLQEEFDRRTVPGGDLHDAAQASEESFRAVSLKKWKKCSSSTSDVQVVVALLQGAMVRLCQPGDGNEASLSTTFPKYARVLQTILSPSTLWNDRVFFLSLSRALLRYRSKLPKETRDAVVHSWLEWLNHKGGDDALVEGAMTCTAHELLLRLLNDWAALGNLVLPRDKLVEFATQVVSVVNDTEESNDRKLAHLWIQNGETNADFEPIRKQYERMLKHLPAAQAKEWKQEVGIAGEEESVDAVMEDKDAMETTA